MKNYVYIAQSLDGFIAGRDGNLDWLNEIPNPDNDDFGFAEFLDKVDAVVMGRKTFEKVMTFGMWPYTKPVYVISSTLKNIPKGYSDKTEILNLAPSDILEEMNLRGLHNLYIDGGTVIQSFLEENLIDEMIITTVPIILGGGISLFGILEKSQKFQLQKSEVLMDSLVKNYYVKKGGILN